MSSSYGENLDLADLKRCIVEMKEVSTEYDLLAEAKALHPPFRSNGGAT